MDLPSYLELINKADCELTEAQLAITPELKDQHINEAKNILLRLSLKISGHREYFRDLNDTIKRLQKL